MGVCVSTRFSQPGETGRVGQNERGDGGARSAAQRLRARLAHDDNR